MKRLLSVVLIAMFAMPVGAGEILLKLDAPGVYYLRLSHDAQGNITYTKIQAVTLTGPNAPDPVDPTDPVDPDPEYTRLQTAIKNNLAGNTDPNKHATAAKLSVLYKEIGRRVKDGELQSPELIQRVTKLATDQLLQSLDVESQWASWRQVVSVELSSLFIAGDLATTDQYVKVWGEVETAMADFAGMALNRADINVTNIIAIITQVIALLRTLFPQLFP